MVYEREIKERGTTKYTKYTKERIGYGKAGKK
jgi:hypothetical protein